MILIVLVMVIMIMTIVVIVVIVVTFIREYDNSNNGSNSKIYEKITSFERGIVKNPLSDWNGKEVLRERNAKESFVGVVFTGLSNNNFDNLRFRFQLETNKYLHVSNRQ